jgi:hypothetical protein
VAVDAVLDVGYSGADTQTTGRLRVAGLTKIPLEGISVFTVSHA